MHKALTDVLASCSCNTRACSCFNYGDVSSLLWGGKVFNYFCCCLQCIYPPRSLGTSGSVSYHLQQWSLLVNDFHIMLDLRKWLWWRMAWRLTRGCLFIWNSGENMMFGQIPWWLWSVCRWVDRPAPHQRAARCRSCPWNGRKWFGRAPRRSNPCPGTFWSHGEVWTARLSQHHLARNGIIRKRNKCSVRYVAKYRLYSTRQFAEGLHCLLPAQLMSSKTYSGTLWGINCANHFLSPPLRVSLR